MYTTLVTKQGTHVSAKIIDERDNYYFLYSQCRIAIAIKQNGKYKEIVSIDIIRILETLTFLANEAQKTSKKAIEIA